ncbi:MAG TPA: DUF885 domain-containing protein [Terriglobia bacterium]
MLRSGLAMAASGLVPADGISSGRAQDPSDQTVGAAPRAAAQALEQVIAKDWDWRMEHNPTWASMLGDHRWNDRWEDFSLEAIVLSHQHGVDVLAHLQAIDRSLLSGRDQLNQNLLQKDYQTALKDYQLHAYLMPFNSQREGIQTSAQLADALPFVTLKDYEDWLARLRSFPACLDQTTEVLRQGIREKMVLSRAVLQRVPGQLDKQIVRDPRESDFYKPFRSFAAAVPTADQERLAKAAQDAIGQGIVPALARYREFYVKEYLPACYPEPGIWQAPNGAALYDFLVRKFTTTDLTPAQVHQIGLDEVARISGEMEAVRVKTGFQGSRAQFFQYLRTDPQFFEKTPEDLLKTYRATAKQVDPELVKLFRTLPRMPYGVKPIPDAVAPDTTAAYYSAGAADGSRAGTYYVNLYRPETRPKWEMTALTLHESVPGHHVQIALAMEQTGLPNFRRYGYYNAFGEGWGLYAESLGDEMGLYDDRYAKFGQLTYDMWRAVRLVVDTGMHATHWDRQKAIDYFMENAAKEELDVVNEIDRYIAWPGQALAYKIGQLKIRELRNQAAEALGPRFDVREFHNVVLRDGPLPLDILGRNVNEWIGTLKA